MNDLRDTRGMFLIHGWNFSFLSWINGVPPFSNIIEISGEVTFYLYGVYNWTSPRYHLKFQ